MTIYNNKARLVKLHEAYSEIQAKYAVELAHAREMVMDYLLAHPDKEITVRDAANMTGMPISTARDFLEDKSYWYGPLYNEKKTVTRKYVYLDEDGEPDMDTVEERTQKLNVYRAKTEEEKKRD